MRVENGRDENEDVRRASLYNGTGQKHKVKLIVAVKADVGFVACLATMVANCAHACSLKTSCVL